MASCGPRKYHGIVTVGEIIDTVTYGFYFPKPAVFGLGRLYYRPPPGYLPAPHTVEILSRQYALRNSVIVSFEAI